MFAFTYDYKFASTFAHLLWNVFPYLQIKKKERKEKKKKKKERKKSGPKCGLFHQWYLHSPSSTVDKCLSTLTSLILNFSWRGFNTIYMLPDGDCSHEIKRRLLFGRKAMTNLDSVLKSRDITLPTKVHLVKAMVFPVVMYECESWTIKKTECWRTVAFELWCWRRLLRVSWTARRSNQSILKKISPGCSLERHAEAETPILWPPDVKNWLIEKDPDAGKDWRQEEKGRGDGWMASLTRWTWVWVGSGSWWWTGRPGVLWFMGSQRVRHDWATELNWTDMPPA